MAVLIEGGTPRMAPTEPLMIGLPRTPFVTPRIARLRLNPTVFPPPRLSGHDRFHRSCVAQGGLNTRVIIRLAVPPGKRRLAALS
jgi:hypothetical protein